MLASADTSPEGVASERGAYEMADSDTGDHFLKRLKSLAGADAHLPQTNHVSAGERATSENAPDGRDFAFSLQEAEVLSAHPELLGSLRDSDKSVIFH